MENKHTTYVESCPLLRLRVSVCAFTLKVSDAGTCDLGSIACPPRPSYEGVQHRLGAGGGAARPVPGDVAAACHSVPPVLSQRLMSCHSATCHITVPPVLPQCHLSYTSATYHIPVPQCPSATCHTPVPRATSQRHASYASAICHIQVTPVRSRSHLSMTLGAGGGAVRPVPRDDVAAPVGPKLPDQGRDSWMVLATSSTTRAPCHPTPTCHPPHARHVIQHRHVIHQTHATSLVPGDVAAVPWDQSFQIKVRIDE